MYHNYVIGFPFDVLELFNHTQFEISCLYLRLHLYIDNDFVGVAKIVIFERFYDGLERQKPRRPLMKMRKTEIGNSRKGTFRFEHIESNLHQTFISFIFCKNIKIITARENERELTIS